MKSILLFAMLFFLIGCGKDGAIGPQGEKGEQGEEGINGSNGNTIYSGKATPSNSIGVNGDFFLNLLNGDLYGPKSSEEWGKPFSLKGVQGEAGTPGATILSGSTVPLGALGKNGDFYINLVEMTIYGPKSDSGWGSAVSLKSDVENSVSTYIIKPDWNKNLINTNTGVFTTSSEDYVLPGNVNSTYYLFYAAASSGSQGLNANISLNQWKELVGDNIDKSYVFPYIGVNLDPPSMENVKVERKLVSSNTLNSKYKFQIAGKGTGFFRGNSLWILVKSFNYSELKANNKSDDDIKRYLRLQ